MHRYAIIKTTYKNISVQNECRVPLLFAIKFIKIMYVIFLNEVYNM